MQNQMIRRTTENIATRRVNTADMKTIPHSELVFIHRHMMQQIPAINRMRELLGKKPIIVPED